MEKNCTETILIQYMSNKERNKEKKSENGNGGLRQNILAIHWNLGSKMWERKRTEIKAVMAQYQSDIFIVSEVNLKTDLEDFEKDITGYEMILPKSAQSHNFSRIVMLIKQGVQVEILDKFMDDLVAAIWIKIGAKGRKQITMCGIYREHKYIHNGAPEESESPASQKERWYKFVSTWTKATGKDDVIVFSDTNLDYVRWATPAHCIVNLVNKVKDEIETLGYFQMIEDITRT